LWALTSERTSLAPGNRRSGSGSRPGSDRRSVLRPGPGTEAGSGSGRLSGCGGRSRLVREAKSERARAGEGFLHTTERRDGRTEGRREGFLHCGRDDRRGARRGRGLVDRGSPRRSRRCGPAAILPASCQGRRCHRCPEPDRIAAGSRGSGFVPGVAGVRLEAASGGSAGPATVSGRAEEVLPGRPVDNRGSGSIINSRPAVRAKGQMVVDGVRSVRSRVGRE
jgi:hypothetical protein